MIKASEANKKAMEAEIKQIEENKKTAIDWVENKIAIEISERAEKGGHRLYISCPDEVEWIYARDFLRANGYSVENSTYGKHLISW